MYNNIKKNLYTDKKSTKYQISLRKSCDFNKSYRNIIRLQLLYAHILEYSHYFKSYQYE